MQERRTDVLIIGAGTAGLTARREVERHGRDWLLVEAGPHGTTCTRNGCMPSKLLIAAANAAHAARHTEIFGVSVSEVNVDGEAVLERLRRERDRFVDHVLQDVAGLPEDRKISGTARFTDGPRVVQVDDHTRIEADAVIVATGARPVIPDSLDPIAERLATHQDVFEWPTLPESVAVFGTGMIGLELGQAMQRLGVRTTCFNPFDELGPFTDPVVRDKAEGVLRCELDLQLGIEIVALEQSDEHPEGVVVHWRCGDGPLQSASFERAIAATGRKPDLARLELENAGLELEDGVPDIDPATLRIADTPIFVAGDASADRPLLHEAADEGRLAALNAVRYPDVRARGRFVPLGIGFTAPNMATVGLRHTDLDPDTHLIGEVSYDDQGRARVMDVAAGHVRIYAHRDDLRLVGAEMFGPAVEHTAHLLAWAMARGTRVDDALDMPFYHPTVEEGLRTALRDLRDRSGQRPSCEP